jgi:hypothetical protein
MSCFLMQFSTFASSDMKSEITYNFFFEFLIKFQGLRKFTALGWNSINSRMMQYMRPSFFWRNIQSISSENKINLFYHCFELPKSHRSSNFRNNILLELIFEPKLSEPEISISIMVNSRSSSKPLRALRYNVQLHSNQSHEYHLRTGIDALRWTSFHVLWKTYDTLPKRCDRSIFGFLFYFFLRVLCIHFLVISN